MRGRKYVVENRAYFLPRIFYAGCEDRALDTTTNTGRAQPAIFDLYYYWHARRRGQLEPVTSQLEDSYQDAR